MKRINVIIMGAAGRDFHNFSVYFRGNPLYDVKAFTAAQIPDIAGRKYPKELAGRLYPKGIPVYPESDMPKLIKQFNIDYVFFSYSDITHEDVMHKASIALAHGANFALLGPRDTQLQSKKPVISICAVRTGAGKSPTTRYVVDLLLTQGLKPLVVRHPMPYGDLRKQEVQRFATYDDLKKNKCTVEEREEYEPHIRKGIVVYAGVGYEKILRQAEKECDIIVWDGGNNDFPFFKSDLQIVVLDPHRAGHELKYHPGEVNFRAADIFIVNKIDTAKKEDIQTVMKNAKAVNPRAAIIKARSDLIVSKPALIRGKRVLIVEDGPTLTHGGMKFGAGFVAAQRYRAKAIVDASKHAVGSIRTVYKAYPHLSKILPAMGYSAKQVRELEQTINRAVCDTVIDGTPVDLAHLIRINKPIAEVDYALSPVGNALERAIKKFTRKVK
ncbi:MAG: GTPase [Candidatus Aenigmarchaeota archaeon]|nr:GTPase [Candidatus Aenigmarchaeota archaeon]